MLSFGSFKHHTERSPLNSRPDSRKCNLSLLSAGIAPVYYMRQMYIPAWALLPIKLTSQTSLCCSFVSGSSQNIRYHHLRRAVSKAPNQKAAFHRKVLSNRNLPLRPVATEQFPSFCPAIFAASLRCITARHLSPMKIALPPKKVATSMGTRCRLCIIDQLTSYNSRYSAPSGGAIGLPWKEVHLRESRSLW